MNLLSVVVVAAEAERILARPERLRWEKQHCNCKDHNHHPGRPASVEEVAVELLVAHL